MTQAAAGSTAIGDLADDYTQANVSTMAGSTAIGELSAPSVAISSVSQVVAQGQPATFEFTVTLTGTPSPLLPVTVAYSTADDTATADDGDYTPVGGTLTWAPGDTSPKTISVPVGAISLPDVDTFFEVDLSDPVNAVLDQGVGAGLILCPEFATTTSLTSSAPSASGDAPVTFTAVVTDQDGNDSPGMGQVEFYDGSTDLGSATLDATGTATLATSFGDPGSHAIAAVYDGLQFDGRTYDQSTSAALTETVARAEQTITFDPIGDQTYGAEPIFLDPSSSSFLPVTVNVISGPATIDSNDVLTITGFGTVVIEASQSGNSGTDAAVPVDESFHVAPAPLTIAADDLTVVYGDAYPTLTSSYSGFVSDDTPESLTTLPTLTTVAGGSGVGTYAIDASGAVDPNYTITYVPGTLTIVADTTTTTITPSLTVPLLGQDVAYTASITAGSTGLPVTVGSVQFQVDGKNVGGLVALDANGDATLDPGALPLGSQTITAIYQGTTDYLTGSGSLNQVVASYGSTIGLSTSELVANYGDTDTITATVEPATPGVGTPAGSVQFEIDGQPTGPPVTLDANGTASLTLSTLQVGVQTIAAIYSGQGSTFQVSEATTTIVVDPIPQTITFGPLNGVTYGAGPIALSASASSGLAIAYSIVYGPGTLNGSTLSITGAGTIAIEADQAGNADYLAAAPVQETLDIAKATPTLSVSDPSSTYTGTPFSAMAALAGIVPGVDNTPGATLEGVAPSLSYFSGTYGSVAQLAGVTPLAGAPTAVGAYTVEAYFPGSVDYTSQSALADFDIAAPLTIIGATPVSPNPRTSAVSSVTVSLSEAINPANFNDGTLTLTDDGGPNLITAAVAIQPTTATTFAIEGLAGLTTIEGLYTLTVNAAEMTDPYGNPGTGAISTTWLMDTTPPTSHVSPLLARGTSLSFPVSTTGSDPNAANGGLAAGVASYAIYVSTNGGAWSPWTTVPAATPTATYTGQSNTTYSFHSIATDLAGNVEDKAPVIEASTYLPDLTPPVTAVDATTGTNPSTVDSTTGTFTLDLTGNDPGGAALSYFAVFVSIDGGTYQEVGPYAIPAGEADSNGNDHSTIAYQGLTDGQSHSYAFYSIGLDAAGNLQAAPKSPNVTFAKQLFAPAQPQQLQVTSFSVEHGSPSRSFIRYLDLGFNESNAQSGSELTAIINSIGKASPDITIYKYDLNGDASSKTPVPLSSPTMLSVIDHAIEIDFGSGGIGNSPTTTTPDGYYEVDIKLPNRQTVVHHFDRLLGDVAGDGVVDQNDLNEIAASIGETSEVGWAPLSAAVTGDGSVTSLDLLLATRSKNRKLASGLSLG